MPLKQESKSKRVLYLTLQPLSSDNALLGLLGCGGELRGEQTKQQSVPSESKAGFHTGSLAWSVHSHPTAASTAFGALLTRECCRGIPEQEKASSISLPAFSLKAAFKDVMNQGSRKLLSSEAMTSSGVMWRSK